MKTLFFLLTLGLANPLWAQTPAEPVLPHAHIHLTPEDLRSRTLDKLTTGTTGPGLQVGQPAPSYVTMVDAARAGVQPFAKPAPAVKVSKPHFILPSWSLFVAIALALLGIGYAWIRSNRKSS